MKNVAKAALIMVLALALCQSAMAAPTQGAYKATTNSRNVGLFDHFLGLFGAIWGTDGAIWGSDGAIWGGPGSGGDRGAIWGGPGSGGDGRASVLTPNSKGSKGSTTQGAIWGCKGC